MKTDKPKKTEAATESQTGATSGETQAPEKPESSVGSTPAMDELKAKMEAKAEAEPDRGPHPYVWSINAADRIPFEFLDKKTGTPSKELIEEHIARAWAVQTTPSIAGVLIGERL